METDQNTIAIVESVEKNVPVAPSNNFVKVRISENGTELEKFECNVCQHRTGTQSGIRAHISNKHSKPAAIVASSDVVVQEKQEEIKKYVLDVEKSVIKKLECSNRDPVVVNWKTQQNEGKSDSNSSMTVSLNLGLFQHLNNNLSLIHI